MINLQVLPSGSPVLACQLPANSVECFHFHAIALDRYGDGCEMALQENVT